jgi:cysteinyl-tRNA synthetase
MEDIFLHNTLSGKKEKFEPIESGKVKIYSCGPTVYDYAHIGNFRSFLLSDLLTRVLKYAGYKVEKVMNITDVGHLTNDDTADSNGEDKIAKKAKAEKIDPFAIAKRYEEAFLEDAEILRMERADAYPRATDHIEEQVALAQKLIAEEFAYEVNGSVYFRTTKYEKYGQLSKNKLEDLKAGARVEVNSEKENPLDFALWKNADPTHLMQWDSPWGKGFPGWHIECSAMARKILGDQFDIHTGGEDNIFPHHECEIAQNECSNDGKKSVNYWLHVKHLLVDGKKMSKSAGNFYTIRDLLEKGWKGEEIRFALLGAHYRSTLDFSEDSLVQARSSIKKIQNVLSDCESRLYSLDFDGNASNELEPFKQAYQKSLFDDLNISDALAHVSSAIRYFFADTTRQKTLSLNKELINFLKKDFNSIFDVLQTSLDKKEMEQIRSLTIQRAKAREEKNWEKSDQIRDELLEKFNVEVLDGPNGQTWHLK